MEIVEIKKAKDLRQGQRILVRDDSGKSQWAKVLASDDGLWRNGWTVISVEGHTFSVTSNTKLAVS